MGVGQSQLYLKLAFLKLAFLKLAFFQSQLYLKSALVAIVKFGQNCELLVKIEKVVLN